jgi:hypothetical protein
MGAIDSDSLAPLQDASLVDGSGGGNPRLSPGAPSGHATVVLARLPQRIKYVERRRFIPGALLGVFAMPGRPDTDPKKAAYRSATLAKPHFLFTIYRLPTTCIEYLTPSFEA